MDYSFQDLEKQAVYKAIHTRRDIRSFSEKEIPDEVLQRVLSAGLAAPSVGLSEPWNFIIIQKRSTKKKLYEHFWEVNKTASDVYSGSQKETYMSLKLQGILDAPIGIVVTSDRSRGGKHVLGRFTMPEMAEYSTCLAIQNLWIASRAEGLGLGWMSLFEEEKIQRICKIPKTVRVIAYLSLGYPTVIPDEPMLATVGWEKSAKSLVFEEEFGKKSKKFLLKNFRNPEFLNENIYRHENLEKINAAFPKTKHTSLKFDLRNFINRYENLAIPKNSLAKFRTELLKLCALQDSLFPKLENPILLVFGSDHGIASSGVSYYDSKATRDLAYSFLAGYSPSRILAREANLDCELVDLGIQHEFPGSSKIRKEKIRLGTRNFLEGPAVSKPEFSKAIAVGKKIARQFSKRNSPIVLGEMGIGNTVVSSAIYISLLHLLPEIDKKNFFSEYLERSPVTKKYSLSRVLPYDTFVQHVHPGTQKKEKVLDSKVKIVYSEFLKFHKKNEDRKMSLDSWMETIFQKWGGYEHICLFSFLRNSLPNRYPVFLDGFTLHVIYLCAFLFEPSLERKVFDPYKNSTNYFPMGEGFNGILYLNLMRNVLEVWENSKTWEELNLEEPKFFSPDKS